MISSVIRSVPLRIASVAAAARRVFSSPIVPSAAGQKLRGQKAALQIRRLLQWNDLFKRGQKFVIRLPARKDCRRESVLNGGNRTDDTHHFLGAETHDRDAKLIGQIAKSV